MNIEDRIESFIVSQRLFSKSDKLLLGVSGGADSVAMLRVLLSLGYSCQVIHCNFHLRGSESDRDEKFVRDLCLDKGVQFSLVNFDTGRYASDRSISVEMAARELRYKAFEERRKALGASVIAVAHHKDDSVETVLINLVRGTGLRGLTGIKPINGNVVRPLLCLSRIEITGYLEEIGQSYVTDSTNLEDDYVRNRIRNCILPCFREINPSVDSCVFQTSRNISGALKIYNDALEKSKGRILKMENDVLFISINRLKREISPETMLFEILYPLGFNPSRIEDVWKSLDKEPGKLFYSDRYVLLKDRNDIIVRLIRNNYLDKDWERVVPERGGDISISDDIELHVRVVEDISAISKDKNIATLDADLAVPPVIVRKWRSGDRFSPYGMSGFKSVSDYLTDRKFDLFEKENQLLVCDSNGIMWLVGERVDNRYRVTEQTKRVLILSLSGGK